MSDLPLRHSSRIRGSFLILLPCILIPTVYFAQQSGDTLNPVILNAVVIEEIQQDESIGFLSSSGSTYLVESSKNIEVKLAMSNPGVSGKTGRQLLAAIPGLFVYDMDGSGNQFNISWRGLDAHRGWELNTRKDGVLLNSDLFAYPASHYSPPMERFEGIEVVHGTSALQYGMQFGGLINYRTKEADTTGGVHAESIQSAGSFETMSQYLAIHGGTRKFSYYIYGYAKSAEGYRDADQTRSHSAGVNLKWNLNDHTSIHLDWSKSEYLYRMSGPLTDEMFRENPRQATRTRNYFNPDIHVPSLRALWNRGSWQMEWTLSAVLGKRNSILFDKPANIPDTINTSTASYAGRQIDIDTYRSFTAEWRMRHSYTTELFSGTLIGGLQFLNNDLHRRQQGKGSSSSDYDLRLVSPEWGRNLHFLSRHVAAFLENRFNWSERFSTTIGMRYELGRSDLNGTINYLPDEDVPVRLNRNFPLFGAGYSWNCFNNVTLYGGISQAYRPVIMKELIPASTNEQVNPDMKDASGYNAETGLRGMRGIWRWDISVFLLQYNNRFGTITNEDTSGTYYVLHTNIGNSLAQGAEGFIQASPKLGPKTRLTVFTSSSFTRARYTSGFVRSGNENVSVKGNQVESVPEIQSRNGLSIAHGVWKISVLWSYTSSSFADALNTRIPTSSGATGPMPSYSLIDLCLYWKISKNAELSWQTNNLSDTSYFTKRPQFYPGPGIWPSDGRNHSLSLRIFI